MDNNEIVRVSDELDQMESTPGWQWLKKDIEDTMDKLTQAILLSSDRDDINRGQLIFARSIFEGIKQIHQNKSNIIGDK